MHSKHPPKQSEPSERNTNTARYELSIHVNWLTKANTPNSSTQQYLLRSNANDRDIPRKVRWDKEPFFALFPKKKIDLTSNNHNNLQNSDPKCRKNSSCSSGLQSQKVSCEKKQKLTVMSKRLSVRKINDFMDVSLSPYLQNQSRQSQAEYKSDKPIDSCQIPSRGNDDCKGKKRIRISLRNGYMLNK